jgi:hypothetical protein
MSQGPPRAPRASVVILGLALFAAGRGTPLAAQARPADLCDDAPRPLAVVNDAALRLPFLRALPQSACPAKRAELEARLELANEYVDLQEGSRSAFLDAETYRLDLSAAVPLGHGREIRAELPLRARSGGFMDAQIESWHDLLGLPQDTRPEHPRNRVRFEVTDSSVAQPLLHETRSEVGLGDVTIRFLQRLGGGSGGPSAALRAALKLPTGSSDDLFGSGAFDAALGLAATARLAGGLWAHVNLDVAALGDSPLDRDGLEQSNVIAQALLALEWRPWARTRFLAQLASESTPLRVDVGELDRGSLQLAWGFRQAFSSRLEAELGIAEDLQVQTAPDLTVQTALRWTPP